MDGVENANGAEVADQQLTPRATVASIIAQCDQSLSNRVARRFSTRDAMKALRRRAETLMNSEDGRAWDQDFAKIVETANAVFDQLIAEASIKTEPAGAEH